jgi:hypothetical protein
MIMNRSSRPREVSSPSTGLSQLSESGLRNTFSYLDVVRDPALEFSKFSGLRCGVLADCEALRTRRCMLLWRSCSAALT